MNKLLLMLTILCFNKGVTRAQLVDIDGNSYKTIEIGEQTWMAENLKVSRFRNGDLIPLAKSNEEWEYFGKEKKPARYIISDSLKNIYVGYNWYAVNDARGLAPNHWHVPHFVEWEILVKKTEGRENLKSASGWLNNGNSRDQFSFNAKPSRALCDCGWWWTASEVSNDKIYDYANYIEISWCEGQCNPELDVCHISNPFKSFGFEVRCIMNR